MEKKTISKLVKPTINEIAKYIPGDSSIDGKKNVIKLSYRVYLFFDSNS